MRKGSVRCWLYGILITVLIGASYCISANLLIRILKIPDISLFGNDPVTLMEEDSLGLFILLEILIAPVIEELLFRNLFYSRLRMKMGFVGASLIVSLVFAVLHLNTAQAIYAFVFSLILCEIAERTANWYLCVSAHVAANVSAILSSRVEAWNSLLLKQPLITVAVSFTVLIGALLLLMQYERKGLAVWKWP